MHIKRKTFALIIIVTFLLGFVLGMVCGKMSEHAAQGPQETTASLPEIVTVPEQTSEEIGRLPQCTVEMIDCGQADAILIMTENCAILIDAGEDRDAPDIIETLDRYGITKLDMFVCTHPHADHIGGAQTIVEKYEIGTILMSPTGHTSKLYKNLLEAIDNKHMMIDAAKPGRSYDFDKAHFEVIAPVESYKDLNDNSVVMIMSYGDTDFLFTGDAENQAEGDFAGSLPDIEILKSGHHGSDTSSSQFLLDDIHPETAIISCGTGNSYEHPKQETLDRYEKMGIRYYRTDLQGDIRIVTDGVDYGIITEKHADPEEMKIGADTAAKRSQTR